MKRIALILAAGSSTRLGEPKQLLLFQNRTLVERTINECRLAGAESIVVVTGAHDGEVASIANTNGAIPVHNSTWQAGMGGSIACGVNFVMGQNKHQQLSVLLRTCDQPFIPIQHLTELFEKTIKNDLIATTGYSDGRSGIPACFPQSHLKGLARLEGDVGAKVLIENTRSITLPCIAAEIDIDTPEDLFLLTRQEST